MSIGALTSLLIFSLFGITFGLSILISHVDSGRATVSATFGFLFVACGFIGLLYYGHRLIFGSEDGGNKEDKYKPNSPDVDDLDEREYERQAKIRRASRSMGISAAGPADRSASATPPFSGFRSDGNSKSKPSESSIDVKKTDGDFLTSMLITQATDSPVTGYLIGGSLSGALVGGAMSHTQSHSEFNPGGSSSSDNSGGSSSSSSD